MLAELWLIRYRGRAPMCNSRKFQAFFQFSNYHLLFSYMASYLLWFQFFKDVSFNFHLSARYISHVNVFGATHQELFHNTTKFGDAKALFKNIIKFSRTGSYNNKKWRQTASARYETMTERSNNQPTILASLSCPKSKKQRIYIIPFFYPFNCKKKR